MDKRLFEAANLGNVEALHLLLVEDPLILERVALAPVSDSPLHVAVLARRIDFVKEIILLRPAFVMYLNTDGFSPIHMASAHGHVEIVKELLKHGSSLCKLKDIDGRNLLHLAAMRGKIDVTNVLLADSPDSAWEVTARAETVLHLAVKYNQFETFESLLENPMFHKLLNAKDQEGNTILHLAALRKQIQMLELLLDRKFEMTIDMNIKNTKNLTAWDILDILLQSPCDGNNMPIMQLLLRAQLHKSGELITVTLHDHTERANPIMQSSDYLPDKSVWREFADEISKELDNSSSKARSALLVVAVLIATVTFQAGVSPPGGVWPENSQDDSNSTSAEPVHRLGEAIMASRAICFSLFAIFNTTGFLMSLIIISLLTSRFPLKPWLRLAVVSMMTTYVCALCFITPFHRWSLGRSLHMQFVILSFFLGAVASWKFWWLKKTVLIIQRRWDRHLEELQLSVISRLRSLVPSRSIPNPNPTT